MASKVNVELSAQVEGFVQGMNTASQSAQKYETDRRGHEDCRRNDS